MTRTLLYFKVEYDQGEDERLERVVADVERQIRKVHGVRAVELTNAVTPADERG
jgi:hypothetical protein